MTTTTESSILPYARAALAAGLCVVPTAMDGSKRPGLAQWREYQHRLPTPDEVEAWFYRCTGMGFICGKVSGNLEMAEFEGRAVDEGFYDRVAERCEEVGLGALLERIAAGYSEVTPSGGWHLYWRISDGEVPGNLKLARRPATPDEVAANPGEKVKVLMETRGEGGFSIAAPSFGTVHPTGVAWELFAGGPETIESVTMAERELLLEVFRSFDQMPDVKPVIDTFVAPERPYDGSLRPGDDYNARTSWADVLVGWTAVAHAGEATLWRRPGKAQGISASTNYEGADRLKVFSTSTEFDTDRSYDKYGAYALLNYGGDLARASSALRYAGYGGAPDPSERAERDRREIAQLASIPAEFVGTNVTAAKLQAVAEAHPDVDPHALHAAMIAAVDAEVKTLVPRPLERTRLGDLMRHGVPEPSMNHPWLYAGGLIAIQAEPGVGKGWIALWICLDMIKRGMSVVYMDEENGEEIITERLLALGADIEAIDQQFFYIPFPSRPWDDTDVAALVEVIAEASAHHKLGAVVLDSLPDFLAMAGLSEDSGPDVTRFVHRLLGPCRDADAALIVLDHLAKPDVSVSGDNKKRGRYARGSGAKLAKAHLTILIETETEFDRNTSGALKVWKTKDRRGRVELPALSQTPIILDVNVDGGDVTIVRREDDGAGVAATPREKPVRDKWEGPTRCMEAAHALLSSRSGVRFSIRETQRLTIDEQTRRGYDRARVAEALDRLERDPSKHIRSEAGQRNSVLYYHEPPTAPPAEEVGF